MKKTYDGVGYFVLFICSLIGLLLVVFTPLLIKYECYFNFLMTLLSPIKNYLNIYGSILGGTLVALTTLFYNLWTNAKKKNELNKQVYYENMDNVINQLSDIWVRWLCLNNSYKKFTNTEDDRVKYQMEEEKYKLVGEVQTVQYKIKKINDSEILDFYKENVVSELSNRIKYKTSTKKMLKNIIETRNKISAKKNKDKKNT